MNRLYYGDNLEVLRKYIADESVDLIYLDPPFNSQANYNILYKEQNGSQSASQIKAFSDFWHWDQESQKTFEDLVANPAYPSDLKKLIVSIKEFLGNNDMSAYLIMMAARLVELRRTLKITGSIYLHCDPTASHYLKILMDAIFKPNNFRNEIVWVRTTGHRDSRKYNQSHDIILFYTKSDDFTWFPQYVPYDKEYIRKNFNHTDSDGRRFMADNLLAAGTRNGESGKEWHGINPTKTGNHWQYTIQKLDELEREGRIFFPESGKMPRLKRYLDELDGKPLTSEWTDIPSISAHAAERLDYPTQKPIGLLERIIKSSCPENGSVLDPFCGCGTALDAAEKLHREWIGIDITHLAINVIKKRLRDRYPDVKFEVIGEPKDLEGARELAKQDRYQFQWWACSLIDAAPYENKKRGADTGIDCVLYNPVKGTNRTYYGIVQVKSGNVTSSQVRDFKGTLEREKADYGIFLTLEDPTKPMNEEAVVAGHIKTEWNASIPKVQILTIKELLEGKQPEFPFPPDNYRQAKRELRSDYDKSKIKSLEKF